MELKQSIGKLVLAVLVLGMAGCKSFTACETPKSYGSGETIPPLQVPAGLDSPDTRGALKIPELNEPEKPKPSGRCLDEPPSYSPQPSPAAQAPKPAS